MATPPRFIREWEKEVEVVQERARKEYGLEAEAERAARLEELPSVLERLYPEMFTPEASYGFSPEEMPDMVLQTVVSWAEDETEGFLEDLFVRGELKDRQALLRTAFGVREEELGAYLAPEEFFRPVVEPLEIPPEGHKFLVEVEEAGVLVEKPATLQPDYSVWVEDKQVGTFDPETGEITPAPIPPITELAVERFRETPWGVGFADWDEAVDGFPGLFDLLKVIAPTKPGAALGVAGAYWQKYISRPWETFVLETRITAQKFYGLESDADNRALAGLESAREKYGWAMYFSPEVHDVYERYIEEVPTYIKIPLRISEWLNPVYWVPVGKGLQSLAGLKFVSKTPVIGKTLQRVAGAVQKAERIVAYPVAKPTELIVKVTVKGASGATNATINAILKRNAYYLSGLARRPALGVKEKLLKRILEFHSRWVSLRTDAILTAQMAAKRQAGAAKVASERAIQKEILLLESGVKPSQGTIENIISTVEAGRELVDVTGLVIRGTPDDIVRGITDIIAGVEKPLVAKAILPLDVVGMTEGEATKLINASKHLYMEIPPQEKIINSALQPNWGKTIAERIAEVPPGEVLIRLIDPREIISREANTIESIVGRNIIGFTEIVKMGQDASAIKIGELQGITIDPVKMFGFNANAYSSKMVGRLLPEYKDVPEAGTLEHIFTKPEMYDWAGFEQELKYVNTVHEINTWMLETLKKEGVAPAHIADEWWIHRVVEGRYDADGELVAIRGRPGMRAITAAKRGYEMYRKAPTMYEGMVWHIKYAENPEVSVRTYIEDAFVKIAQERFYKGTDVALEAIGKGGRKPSEILREFYPEAVGNFELSARELGATAKFHSVINRAIRGEKIPEQVLRAIERQFPELGKRFRVLVQKEQPPFSTKAQELLSRYKPLLNDVDKIELLKQPEAYNLAVQKLEAFVGTLNREERRILDKALEYDALLREFTADTGLFGYPKLTEVGKTPITRKQGLEVLRKEVITLTETKKVPYWQARAERAAKMELVKQPPIGEGYIMQSHFAGKIYDREFIDAVNAFFGHKSGLKVLKPVADIAGVLTTAKAALDISFPAIQGMPAFGLAHSYLITNPKIGVKLMGAWFRAFLYPIRAYVQPEWMHRILAKNEADALQRIGFGGSSMSIDYFRALREKRGLGGFVAKIMHKIPFDPYSRAELAFYGAGEIIRNEFWKVLSPDAIRQGAEFQLAQSLDRMTGLISEEKMGINLTVRQLERSFAFFASQYTRACLTFLGNVFRGGYTGATARKALGAMLAAGAMYYAAVQYSIATLEGKDHDDAWDSVLEGFSVIQDPITKDWEWRPSGRFMSFRIGNYNFGIGGFWYGLVRLSGNISAAIKEVGDKERIDLVRIIKNGSFNKRDNPFIYWWWSRSSMVTHAIAELGSGKDFLGYPIETPWEYGRHIISMFEPIWMEQGVNWMIPGMARDNEIPEGAARKAVIPAELFGLRTFPESQWLKFYDKAEGYIKHIPEGELDEKQIEAWEDDKLEWRHLTDIQKMNLLSRYPELLEFYEQAQADSALRNDPHWKQWQGRTEEEKTIYYDRGNSLWQRLTASELDTRELREMWGEAGQNYGAALDMIEKEPAYEVIYNRFAKLEAEGDKYEYMANLALMEYDKIMFTEYLDEKGDIDWDAKDKAVDEFIEKVGEDTYEIVRQMYAQKKLLEGLDTGLVRLADDKDKLGRTYWRLPYKPVMDMDEEDEAEGNIPDEYHMLWKQYQATRDKEAFIEAHPDLAKDWRAEFRLNNPEADAMLALWGYGGKLQSMEAYNLVVKWGQELGIPLEQMGLGLPPHSLIQDYFELNKVVLETSGGSIQAKLFKLEHSNYLEWGVESWGWSDLSDESVDALRLRVKHFDTITEYEAFGDKHSESYIEDEDARREKQDEFKQQHPDWLDDMRRVKMFQFSIDEPEALNIVEQYVEYAKIADKWGANSPEALLYRHEHTEFNQFGLDENTFDWNKIKEDKVLGWRITARFRKEDEEYEAIKHEDASQQTKLRDTYLVEHAEYRKARRRREAYTDEFLESEVENFVKYHESPVKGFDQERFLVENPTFAEAMHRIKGIDLPDPDKVPDVQYDRIYEMWEDDFDKLEGLRDHKSPYYIEDIDKRDKAREAMRFKEGELTDFGLAEIRRNGYGKFVPEKHIEGYVGFYSIKKPDNWEATTKQKHWYEDDWFLMERPKFYEEIYKGLLGNESLDFSKVPSREIFVKWLVYKAFTTQYDRDTYRLENPDLDDWGVLAGIWTTTMSEQRRRARITPSERFLEDVAKRERAFKEMLRELRAGL